MREFIKIRFELYLLIGLIIYCPIARSDQVGVQLPSTPPNCGITSALAFAHMNGLSVTPQIADKLRREYPQSTVALADVRQILLSLGFKLDGVKATLKELNEMQIPTIIHLTNPDHFVTLLDASTTEVRILENAGEAVTILPRSEIESRFDGYALIPEPDIRTDIPLIRLKETNYTFAVAGLNQKVKHDFGFTNEGQRDLIVSVAGST